MNIRGELLKLKGDTDKKQHQLYSYTRSQQDDNIAARLTAANSSNRSDYSNVDDGAYRNVSSCRSHSASQSLFSIYFMV